MTALLPGGPITRGTTHNMGKTTKTRSTANSPGSKPRTVTVELIGSLKRPDDPVTQEIALPAGATVEDLFELLQIARHHRRFVQAVVDGDILHPDDSIRAGCRIKLFTPVGGG
jgi:sulfur carrier protein ThiS